MWWSPEKGEGELERRYARDSWKPLGMQITGANANGGHLRWSRVRALGFCVRKGRRKERRSSKVAVRRKKMKPGKEGEGKTKKHEGRRRKIGQCTGGSGFLCSIFTEKGWEVSGREKSREKWKKKETEIGGKMRANQ